MASQKGDEESVGWSGLSQGKETADACACTITDLENSSVYTGSCKMPAQKDPLVAYTAY